MWPGKPKRHPSPVLIENALARANTGSRVASEQRFRARTRFASKRLRRPPVHIASPADLVHPHLRAQGEEAHAQACTQAHTNRALLSLVLQLPQSHQLILKSPPLPNSFQLDLLLRSLRFTIATCVDVSFHLEFAITSRLQTTCLAFLMHKVSHSKDMVWIVCWTWIFVVCVCPHICFPKDGLHPIMNCSCDDVVV